MTTSEQSQFLQMISGLLDGTLADADTEQLVERLTADAEAPALYLKYVAFNIHLEWSCGTRSTKDVLAVRPVTITTPKKSSSTDQSDLVETIKTRSSLPLPISPRSRFFSRPVLQYVALVALCLYGSFIIVAWNLRSDQRPNDADRNDITVAMVSGATDVHWSSETRYKADDSSIRKGEPLKIDSGLVELQLKRGAKLVIEGPAQWIVDGDNHATLRSGKLVASVSPQAVGFTLDTPAARIVDLGTKFGVEVTDAGTTDVQVLEGQVQVRPESQGQPFPAQAITLKAGSARRIEVVKAGEAASVQEIAVSPERFVRRIRSTSSKQLIVRAAFASSEWLTCEAHHLVDGSGLKGEAHAAVATNTMWLSALGKVKNEYVLFDFGAVRRVEKMKIWNYNDSFGGFDFYATRGVKQLDVYTSTTGNPDPLSRPNDWKLLIEDRALHAADGTPEYASPDIIDLGGIETRYVAIVIDDHLAPDSRDISAKIQSVGLSEVQFFGERIIDERKKSNEP